MYNACGNHDRFEATALQRGRRQFTVEHYAGPVVYDTEGFLEKNKNEIPRGASKLLQSSRKDFVQLIGKIMGPSTMDSTSASGRAKKRPTIGSQFKVQLDELRNRISNTTPHYIRCLKPNESLQANEFDKGIVADQLRYAGVLEAIRVSRFGYSQRYLHNAFIQRYSIIALDSTVSVDALANAIAQILWTRDNPESAL